MTILEMSVGGALLIAAILVLRRIALYRLPKWSFLLLWVVALFRLLIPFSVPSQFSIYTGVAWIAQMVEKEETSTEPAGEQPTVMFSPATVPGTFREDAWLPSTAPAAPSPEKESVSPLTAVYLLGGALCGLYFLIAYGVGIRRFSWAEPTDSDFLNQWQEEHPTLLPVTIKTCDAICSPMAYGLLRPVVLLPESTDWSDEDQLTYVLTHEYVHIRRGDLGWKLLLTAALCLHWFNPLVWLMYIRANQDLELACDEAVVRILGLDNRKNYAYALIAAAESAFSPLCITYATQNHMEERIRAIMKMKKKSTAVIICAAMLVAGISAVFATSPAPASKNIEDLPPAVMTDQTVKPAPAPAPMEQDTPQNAPSAPDASAAHQSAPTVPDTSIVSQTIPSTPEQNMESVQQLVEPVTDKNESQQTAPAGTIATTLVDRWGVPADPIPDGTEIPVANRADAEALSEYLHQARGLTDVGYITYGNGTISVIIYNTDTKVDSNTYPVNSKGQTYGDGTIVHPNKNPDLINVPYMEDGEHKLLGIACYVRSEDLKYYRYPNEINNPDDAMNYMAWVSKLPYSVTLPCYDKEGNSLGTTEVVLNDDARDRSPEEIELSLKTIEDQLRRNMGLSEEEISKELENYKQSRGWN